MENANIPRTYGALLLGGLFSSVFTGTLFIQCIAYTKSFPKDTLRTKLLVFAIWAQDTLHTSFIWAGLWQYFILHFGDRQYLDTIPLTLSLSILVTATLTLCVHLFFAWRIFKMSNSNYFVTVPIVVLAVCRLGSASLTAAQMIHLRSFTSFIAKFSWVFTLGLSLSSAADILITISLVVMLNESKRRSFSLDEVLDSLIAYTFKNGAVTTAATIIAMICWLSMQDNLIFLGLHFVILKFYANSVLAVLNYRRTLRRRHESSNDVLDLDTVHFRQGLHTQPPAAVAVSFTRSQGADAEPRGALRVTVEKNVQLHVDGESSYSDSEREPTRM